MIPSTDPEDNVPPALNQFKISSRLERKDLAIFSSVRSCSSLLVYTIDQETYLPIPLCCTPRIVEVLFHKMASNRSQIVPEQFAGHSARNIDNYHPITDRQSGTASVQQLTSITTTQSGDKCREPRILKNIFRKSLQNFDLYDWNQAAV